MATSFDTLLNGTTITVGGETITLSSLTENERGILLVAMAALATAARAVPVPVQPRVVGGAAIQTQKVLRSTGAVGDLVVTPGAG